MTKRTLAKLAVGIGGAVVAAATGLQLARLYFEEPAHDVELRDGAFEVRRYHPRVVASTRVALADRREATRAGFGRLADYIFARDVAMTTPVEATPARERIAMTTPVESTPDDAGWEVAFTMPSEYALDDLPAPGDPRVELGETSGRLVGALRFSGRLGDGDRRAREAELLDRVERAGYRAVSEVTVAIYDPPTVVLPFLRRNELLVEVAE